MRTFYRIQPAGLGISGHRTVGSDDDGTDGVDAVFECWQTLVMEAPTSSYGDEVVVIRAPRYWPNGDAEGVRVPSDSEIVARYSLNEWTRLLGEWGGVPDGAVWDGGLDWDDGEDCWTVDESDLERAAAALWGE